MLRDLLMLFAALAILVSSTIAECVASTSIADPPSGYQLVHLQILTRHGARTPAREISPFSRLGSWICDSDDAISGRIEGIPLNFPRRVRRIVDPRLAEFPPNCRPGDLLSDGIRQHYMLGSAYRSFLIDKFHFLDSDLNPDEIFVRATSIDRTVKSAISFLQGLYEPQSVDEILDIMTGTPSREFFRPDHGSCRDMRDVSRKFHKSSSYLKTLDETGDVLRSLSSLLQISDWDGGNIDAVCDWITASFCNEQIMPTAVNETHFQACLRFGAEMQFGAWTMDDESAAIGFSYGMREMLEILDNFKSHKIHAKFVLLSSHDSTVAVFLSLLGNRRSQRPPLASHLAMEIYEDEQKDQFVRFAFNGEVLKLPDFGNKELVRLEVFVRRIRARIEPYCTEFLH